MLVATVATTQSTDRPADLTGADANQFRSQVGHTVILRGCLEEGKEGLSLVGAGPNDVELYVIPEMPSSGVYSYPKSWTRFLHQQVRLTGELRFRSFPPSKAGPAVQAPPDYFCMVLQRTTIERVGSK